MPYFWEQIVLQITIIYDFTSYVAVWYFNKMKKTRKFNLITYCGNYNIILSAHYLVLFFFNPSRVVWPIFLSPKLPVFKKIYELLEEYKLTPQYRYRFVHQLFHFLGKVNSTYGLIYPYIVVKEDYNDQWIKCAGYHKLL